MSRGPGRWQRAILERLRQQEQFFLAEIVPMSATPHDPSRAAARAAMRAAHRLANQGLIALDNRGYGWSHFYWTGERYIRLSGLIVARPGQVIDRWGLIDEYDQRASAPSLDLSGLEALARLFTPPEVSVHTPTLPDVPEVSVHTTLLLDEGGTSARPRLQPFQLGAVASGVKVLTKQGRPVEASTIEQELRGALPRSIIDAALDQLKASGDYQRLLAEANHEA
jgi:hypothetical protein